jgi:malonyl-CoA O-methyltransferase
LAGFDHLPLPADSVDVVLCGLALGHEPRLQEPLREIARVLRPGGTAILSDVHPFLALTGAQRTFTDKQGKTYAVQHTAHLAADYWQAAHAAGLQLSGIEEPRLLADDAWAAPQPEFPVVLVLRFEKTR